MAPSCTVCQDKLVLCDDTYAAKCGHVLHHACWLNWLGRSNTCPECRQKTLKKDLIRLYFNTSENDDSVNSNNVDTCTSQVDMVLHIHKLMMEMASGKASRDGHIHLLDKDFHMVQSDVSTIRSSLEPKFDSLSLDVENLAHKITSQRGLHQSNEESWQLILKVLYSKLKALSRQLELNWLPVKNQLKDLQKNITQIRGDCETVFESLLSETEDFKEQVLSPSPCSVESLTGALYYLKVKYHSLSEKYEIKINALRTKICELGDDTKFARDDLGRAIDSLSKEVQHRSHEISILKNNHVTKRDPSPSKNRSAGRTARVESSMSAGDNVIIISDSEEDDKP